MKTCRYSVVLAGLPLWIYSWYFLRGVQTEYAAGEIGPMPFWLLFLLGITTTGVIGTVVAAALGSRTWPVLAIASAVVLPACIALAQQSVMRGALQSFGSRQSVDVFVAARAALKTRPAWELAVMGLGCLVFFISSFGYLMLSRLQAPRVPRSLPREIAENKDGSPSWEEGT